MKKKKKRPYKRRHYFVKRRLQFSFIIKFFILALLSSIIINIVLYFLLDRKINEIFYSAHISAKSSGEIVGPYLILINLIIIPLIILVSFKLIRSFVKKISGPILKFSKTAEGIARGNLSLKIDLRKEDHFSEFKDKFNFMIEGLRENIASIKHSFIRMRDVEKSVDELMAAQLLSVEELKEKMDLFFQSLDKFEKNIKVFKFLY